MRDKVIKARRKTLWNRPPKSVITSGMYYAALRELYDVHFEDEKLRIEYDLIRNYESKVSPRLVTRLEELTSVGKVQAKEMFRKLIYSHNPFLDLDKKQSDFVGKYIPVPLEYK